MFSDIYEDKNGENMKNTYFIIKILSLYPFLEFFYDTKCSSFVIKNNYKLISFLLYKRLII